MVISLAIFYYLYLVILGIFVLYSLFNIYHLLRFGFLTITNILVIIIYLAAASWLVVFSLSVLMTIDWSRTLIDLSGFANWKSFFNFNINLHP